MSALLAGVVVLAGSSLTVHAEGKYTYCYDYWGEVQDSPDIRFCCSSYFIYHFSILLY